MCLIACTKSGEGLLSAKCLLVTNSSYGYHLYYCAQLIDRLFAISNIAPNYTMLLLSVASPPLLVTNLSSYYHRQLCLCLSSTTVIARNYFLLPPPHDHCRKIIHCLGSFKPQWCAQLVIVFLPSLMLCISI